MALELMRECAFSFIYVDRLLYEMVCEAIYQKMAFILLSTYERETPIEMRSAVTEKHCSNRKEKDPYYADDLRCEPAVCFILLLLSSPHVVASV